jgi:FAD/FMN-containing dehydrogenase
MKQFNNIEYNKAKKTIDIGAGVTCGEVYQYLERFASDNAPGVVGGDPTVGFSGWLLGGGYSLLTNQFGLGIDNIVGFQIVVPPGGVILPAGGVLNVDHQDNPDLFKALKVQSPYYT